MEYEWDPEKAQTNLYKHEISFADAVAVFNDPFALTIANGFTYEERFIILGMDAFGELLVVVYVWRDENTIRIISARRATRHERKQYEG
ncbi:MAG: BrnT family toxin [Chloroflexi bacterium AL-W]|nr:BrnT family toxin [Chloroflexi bacterium AL-N1]NOK68409.1 BrnT family toxin [Chloroflexi bacterium AL-N10]NOK74055.1 BrnT family toxin [Chloroflexi bacterium AL-N5]NOK83023.1 BrnT family toxin [Chloroflexi bacterium AL-W]NOK90545.1 BrnT family toxin [Chloroflexi bacterium AL-N15]